MGTPKVCGMADGTLDFYRTPCPSLAPKGCGMGLETGYSLLGALLELLHWSIVVIIESYNILRYELEN